MTTADSARERALVQVQALSGALFALFLALHLGNQALAVLGPDRYDAAQAELRHFYQNPLVELSLVGSALAVHIIASVWRIVRRRRRGGAAPANLRARLQRYSAYFLLASVFGHVFATRGVALIYDAPLGFDGLAYTMVVAGFFFIPYYFLLGTSGLYHLVNGLTLVLPRLGLRLPAAARSGRLVAALALAGALAIALAVASFAGAFHDVEARALSSRSAEIFGQVFQ